MNILGNCLPPTNVVQNLGVLFDTKFSFTNHVNSVIKSCFANVQDLHHIRRFLSYDVSVMVANALVSRLDYCNSLFRSLSSKNITGFKISKIVWHALSLVLLDSLMSLQS